MKLEDYLVEPEDSSLFYVASGTASEACDAGWERSAAGWTVRFLRGTKMRSVTQLFDEVSAALQFPWYFGQNKDAFDDCMTDLGWLRVQLGYLLIIYDADQLLNEEEDELRWFVSALNNAVSVWAAPVADGESWDRSAIPFRVVFQTSPTNRDNVVSRLQNAGAKLCVDSR